MTMDKELAKENLHFANFLDGTNCSLISENTQTKFMKTSVVGYCTNQKQKAVGIINV